MITFSNDELMGFLSDDAPFLDNTTFGLNINGFGEAKFYPKNENIVLCGIDEVIKIAQNFDLKILQNAKNGEEIPKKQPALILQGDLKVLLRIAKSAQNLLEYASAVATYTNQMLKIARNFNPNISILGTRKTMPFAKKLQLKGLIAGGGIPHRYGLSDSILIFKEHLECVENKNEAFARLKNTFKEHKIIVEIENYDDALYFATLGADILQAEKLSPQNLQNLTTQIKAKFPHILISATGGVNLNNVGDYAKSGVDMIVTTSMYRAPILDIKVEIHKI